MAKAVNPIHAARVAQRQALQQERINTRVNRIAANTAARIKRYERNHPNAPGNITPGAGGTDTISVPGTPDTSNAYTGGGAINTTPGGSGGGGTVDIPSNANTQSAASDLAQSASNTNMYLLIGVVAIAGVWLVLHYMHK